MVVSQENQKQWRYTITQEQRKPVIEDLGIPPLTVRSTGPEKSSKDHLI